MHVCVCVGSLCIARQPFECKVIFCCLLHFSSDLLCELNKLPRYGGPLQLCISFHTHIPVIYRAFKRFLALTRF